MYSIEFDVFQKNYNENTISSCFQDYLIWYIKAYGEAIAWLGL